jgi:exodeoxyribonuclease VII large subunit
VTLWGDDSPLGAFAQRQKQADTPPKAKAPPEAEAPPKAEPPPKTEAPSKAEAPKAAVKPGARERPMSVSQAVRAARHVLEKHVGTLWIEGETTSVTRASSGHVYFGLKDGQSQIRAVIWRSDAQRLRFRVEDGQTLRCRGQMTIYERDGKFQLYVQYAEPAGLGADALALEQLKRKLAAEGLFDAARKRPLPLLPRRIGVVTSKSGAAVRDVIRAVQRRFPVPILVADATVQGASAPREIARAIQALCRTDVDIVIVGRGGGSASDLSAFNDEAVVRAIAGCPVPTISAVGHEIDVSLADLAADHRAATPTMAGEMAVPVLADLADLLQKEERRLHREMVIKIEGARQEIDQRMARAQKCTTARVGKQRHLLAELHARLERRHPRAMLVSHGAELRSLSARIDALMRRKLDASGRDFSLLAEKLDTLSPLKVLQRGYAIATSEDRVITDARAVAPGDSLTVRLARGSVDCRVEGIAADLRDDEP